jgi:hypothetical protein
MAIGFGEPEIARPASVQHNTKAQEQSPNSLPVKIVRDVRLLLIAVWLGAAVFFSFAVAPSVFSVLPARELAGAVVSRTLSIVNTGGFILSLLLLLSAPLFKNKLSRRAFYAELLSLGLIALTTFAGQWIIAARLQALRLAMGRPIDEIAANDPLRIAFNSLHGYSVTALSLGMIAAVITLLLIARRTNR